MRPWSGPSYQKVIDTILAVIIGLLAVAVVIALIGVANTLSLSVIERRRESATLRAIGLSRSQLRWMLAIEGMLIAGVGALARRGAGRPLRDGRAPDRPRRDGGRDARRAVA